MAGAAVCEGDDNDGPLWHQTADAGSPVIAGESLPFRWGSQREHRVQGAQEQRSSQMLNESTRLSVTVLKAVLAGETYDAIASAHGVTRTAIERRVKRLAKLLQRQVGITGLNLEATGYVQKLREARSEVKAALERFELGECLPEVVPLALDDHELRLLLRRAALRSPTPLRDRALIHIVLATGARPLEVARLQIVDYLNVDGSVRLNSEMRAEVSANRKSRPLFFRNAAANKAIGEYLRHRAAQVGIEASTLAPYRGFDPTARLFLNDAGDPYLIQSAQVEGRSRFLCRQMLDAYRKIFARVNMHGVSALTLRRTVALRLDARGADEEQIGVILGIAEKQAVRELLPRRPEIADLMTNLYAEAEPDVALASSRHRLDAS